jgi:thiol-disulfide isomerase/thioredoxin
MKRSEQHARRCPPTRALIVAAVVSLVAGFTAAANEEKLKETPPLEVGHERPELFFRGLDGSAPPSWEELEGHVVVIDFWASWCAPCVAAFPKLNELEGSMADDPVVFYSVTYEPPEHVRRFLAEHPLASRIGIDHDLETFRSFNSWGIPTVYLFGPDGRLAASLHPNDLDRSVLETVLAGGIPDVEQARAWSDPSGAEAYFRKHQSELREEAGREDGR